MATSLCMPQIWLSRATLPEAGSTQHSSTHDNAYIMAATAVTGPLNDICASQLWPRTQRAESHGPPLIMANCQKWSDNVSSMWARSTMTPPSQRYHSFTHTGLPANAKLFGCYRNPSGHSWLWSFQCRYSTDAASCSWCGLWHPDHSQICIVLPHPRSAAFIASCPYLPVLSLLERCEAVITWQGDLRGWEQYGYADSKGMQTYHFY